MSSVLTRWSNKSFVSRRWSRCSMNLFENLALWVAGFPAAEIPPTRYGLANVPHFMRRPCPLAWGGLGMFSGGVVFRGLSRLLHQEDALGVPCWDTVMGALRGRGLAGAAIRRDRSLRFHLTVCYTGHRLASADAFAVVCGGCTGREVQGQTEPSWQRRR